jgi:hypothetical protein
MINHEKKIIKAGDGGGHRSGKKSLPNSGANLFIPQGNPELRTGDIYTPVSTVPSAWVTAGRLKRDKRSLGCHP